MASKKKTTSKETMFTKFYIATNWDSSDIDVFFDEYVFKVGDDPQNTALSYKEEEDVFPNFVYEVTKKLELADVKATYK